MQISIENAEQLYMSNIKMICKLAYNITKNKESADDLKQEAYFILLDSIRNFKPEKNTRFTTYLYSCLSDKFKTIITTYRSEHKKFNQEGYIFRKEMITSRDRGAYFYSKYDKFKDMIYNNCQQRDKNVFKMYVDGVNTKRIAKENDISIQTVFNILERIEKMSKKLIYENIEHKAPIKKLVGEGFISKDIDADEVLTPQSIKKYSTAKSVSLLED